MNTYSKTKSVTEKQCDIKNLCRREVHKNMMPMIEFRGDGNTLFISGYANITEKQSHFLNEHGRRFKEVVAPSMWSKALSRVKEIPILFNHQETRKLNSWKAGKQDVKLFENEIGLKVELEINDSEIIQKVKEDRSFLKGWSWGFVERSSKWLKQDGYDQRILYDVELLEISLLGGMTKPAYPSANVFMEVRSEGILERRFTDFELKESNTDFSRYHNKYRYLKLKGLNI
jgi:uncharacterized protein